MKILAVAITLLLTAAGFGAGGTAAAPDRLILVDDFESYEEGSAPSTWRFFTRRDRAFLPPGEFMSSDERFYVVREGGNSFLRGYTNSESQRISLGNGHGRLEWNLTTHPKLSWRWRAHKLPKGAREDKLNDTGAAVYVTFDKKDWLGRPYSIKYTYSSTLPKGTDVDTGPVKVVVVSSGRDGIGDWVVVERNVAADYRRVFGSAPPDRPFSITLWSDSDDTRDEAEADFDNIRLLP